MLQTPPLTLTLCIDPTTCCREFGEDDINLLSKYRDIRGLDISIYSGFLNKKTDYAAFFKMLETLMCGSASVKSLNLGLHLYIFIHEKEEGECLCEKLNLVYSFLSGLQKIIKENKSIERIKLSFSFVNYFSIYFDRCVERYFEKLLFQDEIKEAKKENETRMINSHALIRNVFFTKLLEGFEQSTKLKEFELDVRDKFSSVTGSNLAQKLAKIISQNKKLIILNLFGLNLADGDISLLMPALRSCAHLKSLDLSYNEIKYQSSELVKLAQSIALESLSLKYNPINDPDILSAIAMNLANTRNLLFLDLGENELGDKTLKAFVEHASAKKPNCFLVVRTSSSYYGQGVFKQIMQDYPLAKAYFAVPQKALEIAAEWWGKYLPKTFSQETIASFKLELKDRLIEISEFKSDKPYKLELYTDYCPLGLLADVARAHNIPSEGFPLKTLMCIAHDGTVLLWAGYRAPAQILYFPPYSYQILAENGRLCNESRIKEELDVIRKIEIKNEPRIKEELDVVREIEIKREIQLRKMVICKIISREIFEYRRRATEFFSIRCSVKADYIEQALWRLNVSAISFGSFGEMLGWKKDPIEISIAEALRFARWSAKSKKADEVFDELKAISLPKISSHEEMQKEKRYWESKIEEEKQILELLKKEVLDKINFYERQATGFFSIGCQKKANSIREALERLEDYCSADPRARVIGRFEKGFFCFQSVGEMLCYRQYGAISLNEALQYNRISGMSRAPLEILEQIEEKLTSLKHRPSI